MGRLTKDYKVNLLIKHLVAECKDKDKVANGSSDWVESFNSLPFAIKEHIIFDMFRFQGKIIKDYCSNKEDITIPYIGTLKRKTMRVEALRLLSELALSKGYSDIKDVPTDVLKEIQEIVSVKIKASILKRIITKKETSPFNRVPTVSSDVMNTLSKKLIKPLPKNK